MAEDQYSFYKKNPNDKTIWVNIEGREQVIAFTFDKVNIYYLYRDYPHKLTAKEKAIFDAENPYWVNFFKEI